MKYIFMLAHSIMKAQIHTRLTEADLNILCLSNVWDILKFLQPIYFLPLCFLDCFIYTSKGLLTKKKKMHYHLILMSQHL